MGLELPSGVVTFLFTDIEGSTKLLHKLGAEAYAAALADHRRIVRDSCGARGGVEVDTQGDAFFFAFPTPTGALEAARAITEELATGAIRVRIGVHTGMPLVAGEGYVGEDVHVAARVAASGHGGQVLVSGETAAQIEPLDSGPQALLLLDLGEHRLKDIGEPVAIFQLGDAHFPPLRTIANTNLPRPASSFVGRNRELREVVARIERGARLVTLTGPGGSGKTRLAIEAAAELVPEYRAGTFWVALTGLRDHALVSQTIAQAIAAKNGLAEHIADREMLLLVDNFEQVVDAAPELSALLSACPNLTLLVTSRELLRISGEVEYPVPPLAATEAVSLFCERAQLEATDEIGELCARLDNLPLAVELAAARAKALSPAQILERLADRLDVLRGGRDADPRQQTLRAAIEWSYDLLSEPERRLFSGLAVFAGGCTLDAAEAVCDADLDTLQSLVEKSLLRFTVSEAGSRYWMLETIREFADERLRNSAEGNDIRRRHAEFFLALAETANLTAEAEAGRRYDTAIREQDNLRAAIDQCLAAGEIVLALQIAVALENFWVTANPLEGMRRFEALLEAAADVPDRLRARALRAYGGSSTVAGRHNQAQEAWEESLALFQASGTERDVAVLLHRLGTLAVFDRGRPEEARPLLEESLRLFRRSGSVRGEGQALGSLGYVARAEGRLEQAMSLFERSAEIVADLGITWWQARMASALTECALELGRFDLAESRAREVLALATRMRDRQFTVFGLAYLASAAAASGDAARSGRLWGAVEAEEGRAGPVGTWEGVRGEFEARVRALEGTQLDRAIDEGRRLSLEGAVEYALSESSTDAPATDVRAESGRFSAT